MSTQLTKVEVLFGASIKMIEYQVHLLTVQGTRVVIRGTRATIIYSTINLYLRLQEGPLQKQGGTIHTIGIWGVGCMSNSHTRTITKLSIAI